MERIELSFPGPQPGVIATIRHPSLYLIKNKSALKGFLRNLQLGKSIVLTMPTISFICTHLRSQT